MSRTLRICLCVALCLVFLAPFGSYAIVRGVKSVLWDRNVGGHIKRAADSNSVDLAKQELAIVVDYLDANNITTGYTSVLWTTPDEDVGFWYTNIKTCLTQLQGLPEKASQAEKDMVLLKLRQTLLDHVGGHERVTQPDGISIFPLNTMFYAWCVIGIICAALAVVPAVAVITEFP